MSTTTATVTDMLNSTLEAMTTVIPVQVQRNAPSLVEHSFVQPAAGVVIGITGELPGRLILNAHQATFANIAQILYGMALEGDILESFIGEVGNMVAGNAVTELATKGVKVSISPPTVLVGETKITGFTRGILVPLELNDVGPIQVVLIIDEVE